MYRLTTLNHQYLSNILALGDYAIDLTAGNGHDAQFLLQQVGNAGLVFAFDLQLAAIEATMRRCEARGERLRLFHDCHSRLGEKLPIEARGKIAAVVANLGYLPSGDREIITRAESSRVAVQEAFSLVRMGGVVSVIAYTGHPGGREEAIAMRELFEQRRGSGWQVVVEGELSENSGRPVWFRARKMEE
jgi:23S rRNA U2552 (ribose-2'-O)-methylase RlmE/FtsJ